MEEDMHSWLDSTLADSQFQWEYWKAQNLEDPDDWGSVLAPSFQDSSSVIGRGILLTGADSHSKQSVAVQILGLLAPEAYEGIFLDGIELGACGIAQARKKLDCLLDHFYDAGTGLCLILDGLEACTCRRELLRFLGQKLCEYRLYREQLTPLFLILMDDQEQDIPALLRDCLQLCRLQLPNQERRAAYLENCAKSLRNYLSLEVFAQATEGASYVQLQNLVSLAECYVDSRDGRALSEAELKAFLADQMPPSAPEDAVQSLCRSVQQLVELLPQQLAARGTSPIVSPVPQPLPPTPVITDQGDFLAKRRQEVEQMTPWELSVDLFGEQAVTEMRQMAQMRQ